eukprot:scaffold62683_cov57-Phaeocystis_antarctica.AAC.3
MTISTPGVPERTAAFRGVPRRTRAFWAAHHCPEARESQRNAPKPHSWPRRAGDGPRDFLLGQNDNLATPGVPERTAAFRGVPRRIRGPERSGLPRGEEKPKECPKPAFVAATRRDAPSLRTHPRVRARARRAAPPPATDKLATGKLG